MAIWHSSAGESAMFTNRSALIHPPKQATRHAVKMHWSRGRGQEASATRPGHKHQSSADFIELRLEIIRIPHVAIDVVPPIQPRTNRVEVCPS